MTLIVAVIALAVGFVIGHRHHEKWNQDALAAQKRWVEFMVIADERKNKRIYRGLRTRLGMEQPPRRRAK